MKKFLAMSILVSFGYFFLSQDYVKSVNAKTYFVSPNGNDGSSGTENKPLKTIQKAIDMALPSETIYLLPGEYFQDVISKRNGTSSAPITLTGARDAIVKGGGRDRVIEINHSYIILSGFTIDGAYGNIESPSGYRDKLIYVLGKEIRSGVTGLKIMNMKIKNAGGECIRLRYFAIRNEIGNSEISSCGVYDFRFDDGGKNGEGVYIGTAPEQLIDGKNPTSDTDKSKENWIHHNTFNTAGNECVDIKEGSENNIVEYNDCTGQKDIESGGFDLRGSNNIIRYNKSYNNLGAGVRLGGDSEGDGIGNDVYGNEIVGNGSGGLKIQRIPQNSICGNTMRQNGLGETTGSYASKFNPQSICGFSLLKNVSPTTYKAPTHILSPSPIDSQISQVTTIPKDNLIKQLFRVFSLVLERVERFFN